MARSNGIFFEVLDTPPLTEVGFEIRVVSYADFDARRAREDNGTPLIVISKFIELTMSPEISGVGAGSVTLDLDDPMWTRVLADGSPAANLRHYEHIWQIWENGLLRMEFLGQTVNETYLDESETRTVTIAGPGGADVLRWGVVMTPHYPLPPPGGTEAGTYEFTNISVMGAYIYLLWECQRRNTIKFVNAGFTKDNDSAGEAWDDKPPPPLDPTLTTQVLSADVNFAFGSYTLTAAGTATLDTIADSIKNMAAPEVTIVGHTDSVGTHAYNQTLSENRAGAVSTYLRGKVPQAVLHASGRGETQPIATNATSAGRARNRRVTITYPVGPPAPTEPYYQPPLGINLLNLLVELSGANYDQPAPIRVEWMMRPGFNLDVRKQFGQRREHQVVFYERSITTISKSRERRRNEIANLVAVQNDEGQYSVVSDTASIQHWRQRESYTRQPNSWDDTARQGIAQAMCERAKDERSRWTIKVPPDAPGRRVFDDYNLGDWIGISQYDGTGPNTVEAFRVMTITLTVNANSEVDLELDLQSRWDAYSQRLQARITSLVNHQKAVEVFVQDAEPALAKTGDLWTPLNSGS